MSTKPIITIYYGTTGDGEAPRFDGEYYTLAYDDLMARIIKNGGQPVVTYKARKTYVGKGVFREGFFARLEGDKVLYDKITEPFGVDVLYDKNRFPASDLRKINPDGIKKICNNKYLSYLMTPDFHKPSFLINNEEEMEAFAMSHAGERVALKELDAYGGEKVFVGGLSDYMEGEERLSFPILAQEFIDTSAGTPDGLASGYHDVRVCMFNGELVGGLLRMPSGESLKSNLSFGGSARELYNREVPEVLVEKTAVIDKRFGEAGCRLFSADWGFDKSTGEWKLFEIN
ncbi:hypothetical protein FWH09_03430, partial [Candidatus Saccharibacteria bacterium]|nr:hypothetical protein [Candidatus Saccharibacteria bacterium]